MASTKKGRFLLSLKKYTNRQFLNEKLKSKYKLVLLDDDTFEEKIGFTITRLNVFVYSAAVAMLLIFLTMLLIVFSPLKEYIPGYADVGMRRELNRSVTVTDSLKAVIEANNTYISNIQSIVNQKTLPTYFQTPKDSTEVLEPVELKNELSKEEKKLRGEFEKK